MILFLSDHVVAMNPCSAPGSEAHVTSNVRLGASDCSSAAGGHAFRRSCDRSHMETSSSLG